MYGIGIFLNWQKYDKSFLPAWKEFLDYREILHDSLWKIFGREKSLGHLYQEMSSLSDGYSNFDGLERKIHIQILRKKGSSS